MNPQHRPHHFMHLLRAVRKSMTVTHRRQSGRKHRVSATTPTIPGNRTDYHQERSLSRKEPYRHFTRQCTIGRWHYHAVLGKKKKRSPSGTFRRSPLQRLFARIVPLPKTLERERKQFLKGMSPAKPRKNQTQIPKTSLGSMESYIIL